MCCKISRMHFKHRSHYLPVFFNLYDFTFNVQMFLSHIPRIVKIPLTWFTFRVKLCFYINQCFMHGEKNVKIRLCSSICMFICCQQDTAQPFKHLDFLLDLKVIRHLQNDLESRHSKIILWIDINQCFMPEKIE